MCFFDKRARKDTQKQRERDSLGKKKTGKRINIQQKNNVNRKRIEKYKQNKSYRMFGTGKRKLRRRQLELKFTIYTERTEKTNKLNFLRLHYMSVLISPLGKRNNGKPKIQVKQHGYETKLKLKRMSSR